RNREASLQRSRNIAPAGQVVTDGDPIEERSRAGEQIEEAPVGERRYDETGDVIERRLVIERGREQAACIRQELLVSRVGFVLGPALESGSVADARPGVDWRRHGSTSVGQVRSQSNWGWVGIPCDAESSTHCQREPPSTPGPS